MSGNRVKMNKIRLRTLFNYFRDFRVVHLGLVDYLKRHGFKIVIAVFIAGVVFVGLKNFVGPQIKTISVGPKKLKVEVVRKAQDRAQGLAERESLCENCGMLFLFPRPGFHSIWMKGMQFDIDIIWISSNKVAGITYNIPYPAPGAAYFPTYQPPQAVDAVLEVPAGWAARNGIRAGDVVKY